MNEKKPIYTKKSTPYFTRTGSLSRIEPDFPIGTVQNYFASRTRKKSSHINPGKFGSTKKITGAGGVRTRSRISSKKR